MEDKIFDFAATKDALGQLSADLIALETTIVTKQTALATVKNETEAANQAKDKKIAALTDAVQNALADIDRINAYIEEVL